MSMLDHDYMLNFFGKIYDLSKSSSIFRRKLKIKETDWSGNGDRIIKTDFGLIVLNLYAKEKKLQITLNKVRIYDSTANYSDRHLNTRSAKETSLVLKQIQFFEGVYNEHLDEQLEELGSKPEEKKEELSLEKFSADGVEVIYCMRMIDHTKKDWIACSAFSLVIFGIGAFTPCSPFVVGGLLMANFTLWFGLNHATNKNQKAICEKRKKDAPQTMIEEPKVENELDAISRDLDRKNDAVDAVMAALDKL